MKTSGVYVLALFISFMQPLLAQTNLILNHSFENYALPCPTGSPNGAFGQVYDWHPANSLPTYGVPHAELYCGTITPNYGGCLPGPVPNIGSDGLAYVGFHTRILTPNYNEAIFQVLQTPLVAGTNYTISFDLMNCQSGLFTQGPSDFCVYTNMDTIIPACPSTNPTVVLAGCVPYDSISNVAWKHHSFTFTAPPNANVIAFSGAACFVAEVYYYLDNVVLISADQQVANTCEGDSTQFTILNTANLLAVQWDFDDPASGANNTSVNFSQAHYFTAPGIYQVELIKYFTSYTDTVIIPVTIHPLPVVSLGADTTICQGSTLLLNPGTGFMNYLWQDGSTDTTFTVSNAGTYYVTVSDSNCSATDTILVGISPCALPNVNFYSSDTLFCEKKCLDFFDISTNNPTSWLWLFPGADSTTSSLQNPANICYNSYGTFDVTLIACNAAGCDTLHIPGFIREFQSPPIPIITSSFDTLFCTPAFSYQWYGSSGAIPGATDSLYIYTQQGTYSVVVTDSNGCASSSAIISTSIGEAGEWHTSMLVFPNPGNGEVYIAWPYPWNKDCRAEIVDAMGRLVYLASFKEGNTILKIAAGTLPAGIYLVRVGDRKQQVYGRLIRY